MAVVAFTSGSGTWTVPSGVYLVGVTLIGAGGGGGGSAKAGTSGNVQEGGGGGGGACTQFTIDVVPGDSFSYTVGTGGAGGAGTTTQVLYYGYQGETGSAGGATTFGSYYVNGGSGGGGGAIVSSSRADGAGGAGGSGGSSTGTIYDGGAGGGGGNDGSGYGAGGSVSNAGGGGGGLGNSIIYNFATKSGYQPYTDSSANDSAADGGKVGHYGTGGGGDSGFDGSLYGVGGKGGDGLILLDYNLMAMCTVTVKATNCRMVYNGSEYTSVSFSVPFGSTITHDDNPGLTNYRMLIKYGTTTLETIDFYDSEGYVFHTVSPSSGTITANTTITASGIAQTYTAYIGMGSYYAKYKRNIRNEGATEYTSQSSFTYKMGDRIDVDWYGGGEYTTIIDAYHQQIRKYDGSNTWYMRIDYTDSSGSVVYSVKGSDAYNLRGYNCTINPEPYAASPTSTQDQYRCHLTYNANGGSLPSDISSYQGYTAYTNSSSVSIGLPSAPTRSNYTFKGWSIDEIKSTPDIPYHSTTTYLDYGKYTLYAVWEGNPQTITACVKMVSDEVKYGGSLSPCIRYNLDGSSDFPYTLWVYSSNSSITIPYGSKFYCENTGKTGTCYVSTKWIVNDSTISYVDSGYKTTVQTVTKDTTIIFTPTPYTLTLKLDKNDGSGTTKTVDGTHYVRSDIQIPKYETLGWSGHKDDDTAVFFGWAGSDTSSDYQYGDGGVFSDMYQSEDGKDATITIYAVWGYISTVQFYRNIFGTPLQTIKTNPKTGKLNYGPTSPTDMGDIQFKGWACPSLWADTKSSTDVAAFEFDKTKSATIDVYGVWSRAEYYPITFVTSNNDAYSYPTNGIQEWDKDAKYGNQFKPFANTSAKWQQYQSSYNITYNYDKELKFSKINNVFYEVSAPSYNDNEIHMAVSCGKVGTIDLGTIQDISDSYSATLTTIPVAPFGFSGTFCMDTGVQRSLSVSIVRVSPVNANEFSTDSAQWSNAKWIRALKELMDRWQMMTDGVKLHMYIPAERVNNVPPIDNKYTGASSTKSVNAYITSMPITYTSDSVHKVSMTISFKIGTMYPEPPKLKTNEITVYKDSTSTGKIFKFPSDSYSALPRCPSGIISEDSELFIGWKLNGVGNIMYPGDPFKVSDVSKLYAQYVSYNGDGTVIATSGPHSIETMKKEFNPNAKTVTIIAVGGGGAGSTAKYVTSMAPFTPVSVSNPIHEIYAGGGGGGSGQYSIRTISLDGLTNFYVDIGKGGQTSGADGTATVVREETSNGKVIIRGMFGYGGSEHKEGGRGGAGYYSGGVGGYAYRKEGGVTIPLEIAHTEAKSGDGPDGGVQGSGGEYSSVSVLAPSTSSTTIHYCGGGGGAAPPIFGKVAEKNVRGGKGMKTDLSSDSTVINGTFGGGGGGGNTTSNFGKGGDGYVYLIWGSES